MHFTRISLKLTIRPPRSSARIYALYSITIHKIKNKKIEDKIGERKKNIGVFIVFVWFVIIRRGWLREEYVEAY